MQKSLGERLSERYKLINWFYKQIYPKRIVKTLFVVGLAFGLIPGSWIFGFPILLGYGIFSSILNRKKIAAWFNKPRKGLFNFKIFQNKNNNDAINKEKKRLLVKLAPLLQDRPLSQDAIKQIRKHYFDYKKAEKIIKGRLYKDIGKSIAHYVIANPKKILKVFLTLYLLFSTTSIISLFAIYGLYRFSYNNWKESAFDYFNKVYSFSAGAKKGAIRALSFNKKLMLLGFATIVIATLFSLNGIFLLLDFGLSMLQLTMSAVGFKALIHDIAGSIKNPIQAFTKNPGKIYGVLWGRWLAYAIFPGKVVGSMGPATGIVESQGIFSSILPGIFGSANSWFIFQTGLTTFLTSRVFASLNNIFSSVFFSHNMRIYGDFYGIIGPTSFQIYLGMVVGCFVGWLFERQIKNLLNQTKSDAKVVMDYPMTKRSFNFIYRSKWKIGFILALTPVVLSSAGGASILALVGGNIIAAGLLTTAISATSLFTIDTLGSMSKRIIKRILGQNPLPAAAPPAAMGLAVPVAPAPVIVPVLPVPPVGQFDGENEQLENDDHSLPAALTFTPLYVAGEQGQNLPQVAPVIVLPPAPGQDDGNLRLGFQG